MTSHAVARALLLVLIVCVGLVSCTSDAWLGPLLTPGEVKPLPGVPTATAAAPPAAASTPPPAVTAGGDPAFGLAWFHKPPEDGTSARQLAAEHRYIHLTSAADVPFRDRLREAGFAGPIYTYLVAYAVEGPGPYKNSSAACRKGYTPHDNNFAWGTDDFCRHVHANESWFLHNGAGERLVSDYFGTGRWTYLMNPASPGWQEFSYSRLKITRDTLDYDGVWLDNLDLDLNRARFEMANKDGRVLEYEGDAAFRAAMQGWLAGADRALDGWPIWANLVASSHSTDGWDAYAPYLDGGMEESFALDWEKGYLSARNWTSHLERAERWMSAGRGLVLVSQGGREDVERMRFALASYMLIAEPGKAFFRYTNYTTYYHSLWLFPEYKAAQTLGAPTGPREQIRSGVWRRAFAGGYVEVDVNDYVGELVLR